MLLYFGRRTLMFFWTGIMAILLVIQSIAAFNDYSYLELTMTMAFVACFEFAPGPIVWIYMSEVMNDKGASVGTAVNWTLTLIVGLVTPLLINSIGSSTFLIFAGFNVIAVVFIYFFMKETKGLTEAMVARLYRTDHLDMVEYIDDHKDPNEH